MTIEQLAQDIHAAITILENCGISERAIEKIESAIKNDSGLMSSAMSYRYAIKVN